MTKVPTKGLTERLADKVVELKYKDFSPIVIERAKELMLDGLGAMLAGSVEPVGLVLAKFLKELGGNPQSTVIGIGIKTSAPWAALANGTFCRALDYDPPRPGRHPVGANLPASLALCEKEGLPGWRLIEAFVIGVEIQSRTDSNSYYGRGVRGTLSAAMSASKLLGLDARQTRMALGIAAAKTGGIDSSGTMCNPADSGNAASRGVQAAMLAQLGFTGRENAIEQPYGYGQFLGQDADLEALVRDFTDPLHLEKEPISIKKYPCQNPSHRHIDAILTLYREQPWGPEEIEEIEVEVTLSPIKSAFNYRSITNVEPADGMDGKFSVPYTAAVAAVDGAVGFKSFTDEKRFSPSVVDMLRRVTVKVSSERPPTNDSTWSEVTIRFRNGQSRKCRVGIPRGAAGGEPLTKEERIGKFVDCALRAITRENAHRVAEIVDHIEAVENLDELCTLLRA